MIIVKNAINVLYDVVNNAMLEGLIAKLYSYHSAVIPYRYGHTGHSFLSSYNVNGFYRDHLHKTMNRRYCHR